MFAAITPALITGAFAERKRFGAFVALHDPVVDPRLLADRPLGLVGRRLAVQARARSTSPAAPSSTSAPGVSALDRRAPHRPARRQRRAHGAARRPDDRPRRGPPVVRLVRLQRRLRRSRAGGLAASAFVVTNTAAAAATITWVLASYLHKGKVSVVGAACGAVAGLVAITPASGFVTAGGALVIGLVGRRPVLQRHAPAGPPQGRRRARRLRGPRRRRRCSAPSRPASSPRRAVQSAYTGLIDGNPGQVVTQLIAVGATVGYAVVGHVRDRQGRRPGPRASASRRRRKRPASTWPSTARRPTRRDPAGAGRPPRRPLHLRPATATGPSAPPDGGRSLHPLRRPAMATTVEPTRAATARPIAPLYEARFEHDACGVGFVADAGGRSRDRVLPLALAGLAALGHRGAFGADGESSDGAGRRPAARSVAPRAARRRSAAADRPGDRVAVPAAWPLGRATRHGRSSTDAFAEAGLTIARLARPSPSTPTPSAPPPRPRGRRSPRPS